MRSKSSLRSLLAPLALAAALSSCYALEHRVGNGAQGGSDTSKRQWYILWGLVPLNEVDSQEMAGSASSYDVKSEINVIDVLLNIVTGFVTIYSQTVTVTK
jgi:hypothetical protein